MRDVIPSTRALVAFEACAQRLSITESAIALNLSQSAISHQIKELETRLGVVLFYRQKQRLILTPEGEVYAQDVKAILSQLRMASARVMSNRYGSELHLALLPTFGTRWLMPLIPRFCELHPEITLQFSTTLGPFDFQTVDVDIALHFGSVQWSGAVVYPLFQEEVVPMCHPDFLASLSNQSDVFNAIQKAPLLSLQTRPSQWLEWFAEQGLDYPSQAPMQFEQFSTMARAACAGLGVALLPSFLFKAEIQRRELVALSDVGFKSEGSYCLVYPENKKNWPAIIAFKQWLLEASLNDDIKSE